MIRLSVAGREQQLFKMRICAYGVSTDDSTESSRRKRATLHVLHSKTDPRRDDTFIRRVRRVLKWSG